MMQLRTYQQEAVTKIIDMWHGGDKSVLLTMATGGGKTQVFCEILDRVLHDGGRGMVIAHRKELVDQAKDRMTMFWPQWNDRCGVVMAERNEPGKQIVFASIQTLSSEKRIEEVLSHGAIDVLVTDESQHSQADSYQVLYDRLARENDALLHLGVTATPQRSDGKGLRNTFTKEAARYDISYLVSRGFLVSPRWLAVQTGISLEGVQMRYSDEGKDYATGELADVFETKNCFELVAKTHEEYAVGRQTMAFTVSVQGAHDLADVFNEHGIKAVALDGGTKQKDRDRELAKFKAGDYQVLCNCALFTEGVDIPQVSCIHQVRPTQSDSLYIQIIGRALRIYPDKNDALILDYCPKETRNIVMLGDVLGLPVRKDAYLKKETEEGEVVGGFTYDGNDAKFIEGNPAEIITRVLNYLDASPWKSFYDSDGFTSLSLGLNEQGYNRSLVITPPSKDVVQLWVVQNRAGEGATKKLIKTGGIEAIQDLAEELAARYANDITASKDKRWNKTAPTLKQIEFLKKINRWRDGMTKGDCSTAINHFIVMKAMKR